MADVPVVDEATGSWVPFLIIVTLFVIRWLCYGQGAGPVRFRRWYNLQVSYHYLISVVRGKGIYVIIKL